MSFFWVRDDEINGITVPLVCLKKNALHTAPSAKITKLVCVATKREIISVHCPAALLSCPEYVMFDEYPIGVFMASFMLQTGIKCRN